MQDFLNFARSLGLDLDYAIPDGSIHRVKTFDKRSHANGAYMYFGNWGWAQDWRAHETPVIWTDGKPSTEQQRRQDLRRIREDVSAKRLAAQEKARHIVHHSRHDYHRYLTYKGHEERRLVDPTGKLVVPMYAGGGTGPLVNVQRIAEDGEKLFLKGGAAKGTALLLGPRTGRPWFVEGFATGLTVLEALKHLYVEAPVVCCFFASNMAHLAKESDGFVFADHDKVNPQTGTRAGEAAAIASGRPWVQAPEEGMDANDLHQQAGIRDVAMLMRSVM